MEKGGTRWKKGAKNGEKKARDAPRRFRDASATLARRLRDAFFGPATPRDAPRRSATLARRLRDAFVRLRESSGNLGDLLKMTQTASACALGLKNVAFAQKL